MKRLFFIFIIIANSAILMSSEFICKDFRTTMTNQKGNSAYEVSESTGKDTTKLNLVINKSENYTIIGKEKTKLVYVGKGTENLFFLEKTESGNINLYSLFNDGTLTVSKSYGVFGMAKMNVQTIYSCKKIK